MIHSFALLLGCLVAGEALSRSAGLPIPGAITGMGLLLAGLALRGGIGASLEATATGLLTHLALFLVPGGAGIVLHLARIQAEWLAILAALLVSTVLTLIVTATTFRVASRLIDRDLASESAR